MSTRHSATLAKAAFFAKAVLLISGLVLTSMLLQVAKTYGDLPLTISP